MDGIVSMCLNHPGNPLCPILNRADLFCLMQTTTANLRIRLIRKGFGAYHASKIAERLTCRC